MPRPSLTETEVVWLRETAVCGPWRTMRFDALWTLAALSELGGAAQRSDARELLQRLSEDSDPAIAREASRLLSHRADLEPCISKFGG